MSESKKPDENAKADAWKTPVDLPHATPEDYTKTQSAPGANKPSK